MGLQIYKPGSNGLFMVYQNYIDQNEPCVKGQLKP